MIRGATSYGAKMRRRVVDESSEGDGRSGMEKIRDKVQDSFGELRRRESFHWKPSNLALNHITYISLAAFAVLLITILTIHYFVRKARRKRLGLPSTRNKKRGQPPGAQLLASGAATLRSQIASMRGKESTSNRNSMGGALVQRDSMHEGARQVSLERASSARTLDRQTLGMREKGASFDRTRAWQIRNSIGGGRQLPIPIQTPGIKPTSAGSGTGGKAMSEITVPSPLYAVGARIPPPSPSRQSLPSTRSPTRQSDMYPEIPSPTSLRHQTPPHSPSLRHLALIEANIPARNFSPKFFPPSSPPPPLPKDTPPPHVPRPRARSLSTPQADVPKVYIEDTRVHRPSLSISRINGKSVSSLVLPIFNFSSKEGDEDSESGARSHTPPLTSYNNRRSMKRMTMSSGTSSNNNPTGSSTVDLGGSAYWVTPSTPAGSEVGFGNNADVERPPLVTTSGWDTSSDDEAEGKRKRKSRINIKDFKGKRKT